MSARGQQNIITVSAKRHRGQYARLAVGEAELALDDRDVEAPLLPGRRQARVSHLSHASQIQRSKQSGIKFDSTKRNQI